MRGPWPCIVLLIGLMSAPRPAAANSGAVLSMHPGEYAIPMCIAPQADSGALVLLAGSQNGLAALYTQRVDRRGQRLLGDRGQFLMQLDYNQYPTAIADGSGGIIVGSAVSRGATGLDIVVHRIAPDGSRPYGPDGLVVCSATRDQSQIFLVPSSSGFFFVAWRDDRANLGGRYDIYLQKVSLAGVPQFSPNGIPVNSATYRPWSYGISEAIPDLQGGIILTYTYQSFGGITRAQRVNSAGALQWTANGVDFGHVNYGVRSITGDGSGGFWGVMSVWDGTNNTSYAYHLSASGTPAFAGGVEYVGAAPQHSSELIRDGSGGCFIYTSIGYTGSSYTAVYLQQLTSGGTRLKGTGGESVPFSSLPLITDIGTGYTTVSAENLLVSPRRRYRMQSYGFDGIARLPGTGVLVGRPEGFLLDLGAAPVVGASSTGVLMTAWADTRYWSPQSVNAISLFGQAFDAAASPLWEDSENPTLLSVQDAPADQGGRVRTTWTPSIADAPGSGTARGYRVWRALPPVMAAALDAKRPAEDGMFRTDGGTYLATASGYWELAGEQAAARLPGYALTVTTGLDSTAAGPADQSFMVEAYDDSSHHWYSGTLTGHSVDNLAPGPVPSAAGFYSGGTSLLFWGGVSDSDLLGYEVFRGASPAFTPSASNRIASTAQVSWTDSPGAPAFYRVAARDIHGNLGPSALIMPAGTLSADTQGPREWALRGDWRAGRLRLALDVPAADEGRIEMFDVSGRRLWASAFRADRARAFEFAPPAAGIEPGICFARATSASGRTLTAKVIVLD